MNGENVSVPVFPVGDVGTTYDATVAVTEPTILYEDTVENPFQ